MSIRFRLDIELDENNFILEQTYLPWNFQKSHQFNICFFITEQNALSIDFITFAAFICI